MPIHALAAWLGGRRGRDGAVCRGKIASDAAGGGGFRGESFPAISGAGEHGAIIHYRVTEATNRLIRPNEPYLIDSGAQYPDGTTDITRTIWTGPDAPPAELRDGSPG